MKTKLPAKVGYQDSDKIVRAFNNYGKNVPKEFQDKYRDKLIIHEDKIKLSGDGIFYTIQGEGISIGQPAVFMRLHICNLACTWCFVGGTAITTPTGYKQIEDIKIGDEVLSYKDAKITLSKVTNVSKREVAKLVAVETEKGVNICTPEHEFYINKRKSKTGDTRVLEAQKLTNKYIKYFQPFPNKLVLTPEYQRGYLQGAYVGDGSYSPLTKAKGLYFQVCDKEFAEVILECVNYLGSDSTITQDKRKTKKDKIVYRVTTSRKETINRVLADLSSREDIAGYIAGFYDAEGHLGRNQLILSQKDVSVLQRIKQMLLEFDIQSSEVQKGSKADKLIVNGKNNIIKFFQQIPVQIERKIYCDARQQLKDISVNRVIALTENEHKTEVYDITTTIGNFFANGFLVRNCDAYYTWQREVEEFWKESKDYPIVDLPGILNDAWTCEDKTKKRLVLTGGEPTLQRNQITKLLPLLPDWIVEIETNGTMMPTPEMLERIQFNCSPKLRHSGNPDNLRIKGKVLQAINGIENSMFKFVVMTPEDLDEIENDFIKPFNLDKDKIVVMPQGVTDVELHENMARVAEACKRKGYRLLPRLHVSIWGGALRRV